MPSEMTVTPVEDPDDPRIAAYRHVGDAELLRARGLFVAEGRLVVERVLADPRCTLDSVLLNAAALEALRPAIQSAAPDATVFECPTAAFEAITGFDIHRGCLALVRRPPALRWQDAVGASSLVVVLEGVTNADNVGGVFRNAAAFGAGAVLLSPTCCDPLYRKSIRTSMAHVLRVPFARLEPWPGALRDVRAAGFTLAGLSPRESSMTLDAFAMAHAADRVALLVGAEGPGLSEGAEQRRRRPTFGCGSRSGPRSIP
jgi:tRNA G18 (ribose-2'-O)-methylase SpoU